MSGILSNPQFLAGLNMMQGQSVGDAITSGVQVSELQKRAAQRQQVQQALPQLIQQVDVNNPVGSLGKLIQGGIPVDMATQIIGIAQKQGQQASINRQREAIFGGGMPQSGGMGGGLSSMSDEQLISVATIPEYAKAVELEMKRREGLAAKEEAAAKEQQSTATKATSTTNVMSAIEDAKRIAKDVTATGALGQITGAIGGTAAKDLASSISTIGASIGFDRLQRMRDESKTGGALGAVSEREIELLKADIASLDPTQSQEQFLKNLDKVEKQYKRSYENLKKAWLKDYGSLEGFPLSETMGGSEPTSSSSSNVSLRRSQAQEAINQGLDPAEAARIFKELTGEDL